MDLSILLYIFLIIGSKKSILAQQRRCCEDYCLIKDTDKLQLQHLASKTAYEIVKGKEHTNQHIVPGCKPVKFWLVSRHGTRLPSPKLITYMDQLDNLRNEIIQNYEVRRTKPDTGALCKEDIQLLKNWKIDRNLSVEYSNYLTSQGWQDLKFLAINYQKHYPNVLLNEYVANNFRFRYTNTQRAEASYKAFVQGLFKSNAWEFINTDSIPEKDTLLRPYNECPLWTEVNKKRENETEYSKFQKSEIMSQTLSNISKRLGFKFTLDWKQIKMMWDMCRFQFAWTLNSTLANWCVAFTPREIKVLEYAEDIKYYYKSGFGNEFSKNLPCELVQDMLRNLNSNEAPNVVAYFTHLSMTNMFITALGLNKDKENLRADNFENMEKRKWRTSILGPFTANFAAVKYSCSNDVEPNKVMFYLNQEPVYIEWCKVGLCDWSEVMNKYESYYKADCRSNFCTLNGSTLNQSSFGTLLAFNLFVLFIYFLHKKSFFHICPLLP